MGKDSAIEWTDHTFNSWWGCIRVSPGCEHCYAETLAKRYGFDVWGPTAPRRTFGPKHWQEPLRWNRGAETTERRARVFCASMCDVFEDHPTANAERQKLWPLIEQTPWLDWLLLTKRPENMNHMAPDSWRTGWPVNVVAMTSAEDQKRLDQRIEYLKRVPARRRGLSCEPLLGPLDFTDRPLDPMSTMGEWSELDGIHWVIVGGESGPKARPMSPDWVRSIRDQCLAEGVAFHFKQWGGRDKKAAGRVLDGRTWDEYPALEPAP